MRGASTRHVTPVTRMSDKVDNGFVSDNGLTLGELGLGGHLVEVIGLVPARVSDI